MEPRHTSWLKHINTRQIICVVLLTGYLMTLGAAKLWQISLPLYVLALLCWVTFFFIDLFSAFVCALLASGLIGMSSGLLLSSMQLFLILSLWIGIIARLAFSPHASSDETARLKSELDRTKLDLLDAQETRARFASHVNHELRTPINLIVGFSEAIVAPYHQREPLPDAYREDVQVIYRNAKQLQIQIDDLLTATKMEAAATSWAQGAVDPASLIRDASLLVQTLMERRRLDLSVNILGALPPMQLNRTLFRQALLSLLKSAAYFTQHTRLILETKIQDGVLCIRLDGTEIPFSTLERTDALQESEGMADIFACKRIVEMYHGRVWMQSEESSKTTVFLTIPAGPREPVTPARVRSDLLVLDNDPSVINLFRRYIKDYTVVGLPDIQALASLSQHTSARALVLSNERMQSQIVEIERIVEKTMPIITCSLPGTQSLLRDYGAEYLMKPVTYPTLSAALSRLVPPPHDILVLDDNHEVVQLFSQMLTAFLPDCHIWNAYSGQEGLALIREQHLDAIILDVILPDMNGVAIVQYVRSDSGHKNIPIILISGANPDEDAQTDGRVSILYPSIARPDELIRRVEALVRTLDTM